MKEFFESTFKYIEKLLSPYQFWAVLTIVSACLLLLPSKQMDLLGLTSFVATYKGFISLILIVSAAILVVKIIGYLAHKISNITYADDGNLSDEERAVLLFFVKNQMQGASFKHSHPTVVSLRKRGFIEVPYCPVVVLDGFDYFELTSIGKKRLSSSKFIEKISFSSSQDQKILDFVNSISKQQYSLHVPQKF